MEHDYQLSTRIRFAAESDAAAMLEVYWPYVLDTTFTFEYEVPSETAFQARIRSVLSGFPWLLAEADGRCLGYAYADRAFSRAAYCWDATLSVYLCPEAQGRGLGRALYTLVERILARQGYQVAYGVVTGENAASRRFHEALGYHRQATFPNCGFKFGRWISVDWYEKRLCPPTPPAAPPIPAPSLDWSGLELRGLEGFTASLEWGRA